MSRWVSIKDHRIVNPLTKTEYQTIYPVKEGIYKAEDDMPITCTRCGAKIPEIGMYPENWERNWIEELCPDCQATEGEDQSQDRG